MHACMQDILDGFKEHSSCRHLPTRHLPYITPILASNCRSQVQMIET